MVVKYLRKCSGLESRLSYSLRTERTNIAIITITLFLFSAINITTGISSAQAQQSGDGGNVYPGIFPPDSKPYGLTYGEWIAKWWQWAYLMPEAENPLIDDTGRNCAANQTGPVWFLAGTGGGAVTRECTIPAGKAILFPIINVVCDSAFDPSLDTEAELRACAKADQDMVIAKEVTVNGINIDNLDRYRFQSLLFNLTFPENNINGVAPQTAKAVSDGFWIMLEPLSLGTHEIHFKAALGDPTAIGTTNFALDVRYELTIVEERQMGSAPINNVGNQSFSLQNSGARG